MTINFKMENLKKVQNIIILVLFTFLIFSCTKTAPIAPSPKKPVVTFSLNTITSGIDTIKDTYIIVRGFVADTGNASITDAGFIVSTDTVNLISSQTSSSALQKVSIGPLKGGGGFSAKITGLTPRTKYSLAAYATNSAGTGYSTDSLKNPTDIKFQTTGLKVGDAYQGGIISYIFKAGDTGYVSGQVHGIIAATVDQSVNAPWSAGVNEYRILGVTNKLIGFGKANTDSIIAKIGSPLTAYAAGLAKSYKGGGYSDWFLPSKNELETLQGVYQILGITVVNQLYWSSTEDLQGATGGFATFAWEVQLYPQHTSRLNGKLNGSAVRAVRYF